MKAGLGGCGVEENGGDLLTGAGYKAAGKGGIESLQPKILAFSAN